MQITFDTDNMRDLKALAALVAVLNPVKAAPVIAHADNPATGAEPVNTAALFGIAPQAVVLDEHAIATVPAISLDSEGYPWDARIHSSTKKQTESGAWQLRKGVNNDKAMLARVRAELKSTQALPVTAAPQVSNVAPLFPQAQAAAPAVTLPALTLPTTPTAAPALPPAVTALPPVVLPDPTTVAELMARVGPALASLKMPPSALQAACSKLSIPSLEALVSANRPDLVGAVWRELQPLTV